MTDKKFTYDGDPSSSTTNEVRFLIGDTVRSRIMFDDREIEYQLAQTPNRKMAGYHLLQVKSRQFSRLADEKVGDVSKSLSQVAKQMALAAKELRDDALRGVLPFFGGLSRSGKVNLDSDPDAVQPAFPLGITDYPGVVQLNNDIDHLVEVGGNVL